MGAPDHKVRFSEAASLLDYGFANCHLYECNYESISFDEVTVAGGTPGKIQQYPAKKFRYVFTEPYDEGKKAIPLEISPFFMKIMNLDPSHCLPWIIAKKRAIWIDL